MLVLSSRGLSLAVLTIRLNCFNGLLAKLMGTRVDCVSVLDDCLSVGRGGLLAARFNFEIHVSGRVRYISQFCIKVLMTASWGVGVGR
jgi:hypothetical protein